MGNDPLVGNSDGGPFRPQDLSPIPYGLGQQCALRALQCVQVTLPADRFTGAGACDACTAGEIEPDRRRCVFR